MLEIFVVIGLCKTIGKLLRGKGRKPFWMQVLLVVSWIVGEFAGGIVAAIVHVIRYGENAPMGFGVYVFAILGAALGAGSVFLIAYLLPAVHPHSSLDVNSGTFERHIDPNNPYAP